MSEIDKCGYLMKKSDGQKVFSKRWFVLKGNLLFYFDKKTSNTPSGLIVLEGCTIELAETDSNELFCFKISFPTKNYVLSATSHDLMEEWMKSLACANYDYIKLVANELERQLNEVSKTYENSNEIVSSNIDSIPYSSYSKIHQEHNTGSIQPTVHIPTPPPRSKVQRNIRTSTENSFENLHRKYGAKILRDQERRWGIVADNRSTMHTFDSTKPQLSVHQQPSLIQF